jgi:hypothetical protein
MALQASSREALVYRGCIPDQFAPVLVLGWILTLAIFSVEHETRWGKMSLPSWKGWRWLAEKILEPIR